MKHISGFIISLCLTVATSCGNPYPSPQATSQSLVQLWQAQAGNEHDINNCLIKTRLPNPLAIPIYQRLIARIWDSGEEVSVPVFFTYASNMNLYVILNDRCTQKDRIIGELEAYLERDALLRDFQMWEVDAHEASQVIAAISPTDNRR